MVHVIRFAVHFPRGQMYVWKRARAHGGTRADSRRWRRATVEARTRRGRRRSEKKLARNTPEYPRVYDTFEILRNGREKSSVADFYFHYVYFFLFFTENKRRSARLKDGKPPQVCAFWCIGRMRPRRWRSFGAKNSGEKHVLPLCDNNIKKQNKIQYSLTSFAFFYFVQEHKESFVCS